MRLASVVILVVVAGCGAETAPPNAPAEPRGGRSDPQATEIERRLAADQIQSRASDVRSEAVLVADAGKRLETASGEERVRAAFDAGASGADNAAEIVATGLRPGDSAEVLAAAAMGLGYCKSDATERVLVDLALREPQPPQAVEALFSYYRMRGADKPPPAKLPDDRLLAYAKHPAGRGRAALGHLGRAVKDPGLIDVLSDLAASDTDFEVRRAAALGLAEGPPKSERASDQRAKCLAALGRCLGDADAHVVATVCRAISSYDDPKAAPLLMSKLGHADFNVRVAALEGLGKRKAKEAVDQMRALATSDPSASVRYAAATQAAEIYPAATQSLVDSLMQDPREYVRCAGVEVLGKSEDLTAAPRLATIAKTDPHVRVRETAVGAFEGKKDSQIAKDAVKAALADSDVGIVSTACSVAGKNEWTDLVPELRGVLTRFPRCPGADAREAAVTALSDLVPALRPYFPVPDANPAVRAAAEKGIAKFEKRDPPKTFTRGADLTGELLPGGAPMFDAEPFLVIETDVGTMKVRLYPDQAPVHCAHVAALARSGRYDGLTWHRVVPDFVIQGGCPRGDGSGNAGVTLPLEPTRIPFERGTLGMPRSDHPDTGGCQLFICHSRAPHLDVRYTAFGKVVEGFDVIDKVDVDSKIVRVRVEGVR